MKNVIASLLLVLISVQTNARSMQPSQEAQLLDFNIAPGSDLLEKNIRSGQVEVHFFDKTITLKLQPSFHCPPGRFCIQMMPAPIEITLPIISQYTDRCGSFHYHAERNLMPVDGIRQTLELVNNAHNNCTVEVLPATSVKYVEEGYGHGFGGPFTNVHTFTATQLN